MAINTDENRTGESSGIPERRSNGIAGPSREVSKRDQVLSCTNGALQDMNDGGNIRGDKKKHKAPLLVERKTGLRGLGIAPAREPKGSTRRKTERDLSLPDPEVPYVKAEKAILDLVCSLMERQDRMNEEIFLKLIDLSYRQEDLEAIVAELGPERQNQ